jgi:class 3 adenylate cyclase
MSDKQTILIVDDTPDNISLLNGLLKDSYRTKIATSGEKALRIAVADSPPDLVLLDVMMPEMDGFEVCRRLKENPQTKDIPVIFLTALSQVEDEKRGLEAGAVDFITKPISPPIVESRLKTHLALVQTRREIEKQRDFVRGVFGRYMDGRIVESILENTEPPNLGGKIVEVSILMCDLRGFTTFAETAKPEDAVYALNSYLGVMIDTVSKHGGVLDNIIGDGIMVVFGTPHAKPDDARDAVDCAIAMQQAVPQLNAKLAERGLPPMEMGIGINTGEVIAGNVGSETHMKYSVIGSPVNLASRIEGLTFGGQILISDSTFAEVKDHVRVSGNLRVKVKGVHVPIHIYDVEYL